MLDARDQHEQVRLLRDCGEHVVVGITVHAPEDPDDDRFALVFESADHRTLRLRLPIEQLIELAETLLRLRERRCLGADDGKGRW